MSSWKDKLILAEGHTLKHTGHREKGTMGQTEIESYDVVDGAGAVVGSVVYTTHMALKGFQVNDTVEQYDGNGKSLVHETWNPKR